MIIGKLLEGEKINKKQYLKLMHSTNSHKKQLKKRFKDIKKLSGGKKEVSLQKIFKYDSGSQFESFAIVTKKLSKLFTPVMAAKENINTYEDNLLYVLGLE